MTRVAVIGLGRVGYDFGLEKREQPASHFHCYQKLGAEIAVCDSDKLKLDSVARSLIERIILPFEKETEIAEKEKKIKFYDSYKEMLIEFQPEIVSICTPTPTHKDIVLAVANCSSVKGIMLEKPIADSLQEADEIIKICKEKHIHLSVNHSRRWDLMYTRFAPYGIFNSIIGIHPGPLVRTGIHMLDLFNMFMGRDNPPVGVQSFGSAKGNYITYPMSKQGDWNISGCVTYKDGQECILHSGKYIPKSVLFEVDMFTDTGRYRVTENGEKEEEFLLDESPRYTGLNELQFMRSLTRKGWYKTTPIFEAIKELVDTTVFVEPKLSCTGEDARLALNVALALHYSATHENIPIKLGDKRIPYDYTVRSY